MARRKAGGNIEAISEAVQRGAEALRNGAGGTDDGRKPLVVEAADRVVESLSDKNCPSPMETIKEQLASTGMKEKGVMAGGALLAADGIRRAVTKDKDGERRIVRGAVQTAVGVGAFTAAVLVSRNDPAKGGGGPAL